MALPLRELALFAGAGGGILGGHLLGWRTVCAVEVDSYCRRILLARQRDGFLPRFPIWDDVRTFDGVPWRGRVDVVTGGFPCQDISSAGSKAGLAGVRSGLWVEFARILGEIRPRYAFIENSQHLRTRGLRRVLGDLAGMGFHARWGVLGAVDVGAPHIRKRMWIVAHADDEKQRTLPFDAKVAGTSQTGGSLTNANSRFVRLQSRGAGRPSRPDPIFVRRQNWWPIDTIAGMDNGMAHRMDRVRATGNGQVPGVARLAWRILAG